MILSKEDLRNYIHQDMKRNHVKVGGQELVKNSCQPPAVVSI